MDKRSFLRSLAVLAASPGVMAASQDAPRPRSREAEWALNISVLESCSCPPFCPCFFTGRPPASEGEHAMHGGAGGGDAMHVCRFNQAYRVNSGHAGALRLDGLRFWYAGDAGADFAHPKLDWAVLTFDPHVSRDQRTALLAILRRLRWYQPARWTSYAIGEDAAVEWTADADTAHATLGGGAIGEMRLRTLRDLGNQPVTITNLDYFGYPRNNGFVLMPSERLAYRGHGHAFEYAKTNGMITTVDINAGDFPA